MSNYTYAERDVEFNQENVEYYQDWKNFGNEGSDDEWDNFSDDMQQQSLTQPFQSR